MARCRASSKLPARGNSSATAAATWAAVNGMGTVIVEPQEWFFISSTSPGSSSYGPKT